MYALDNSSGVAVMPGIKPQLKSALEPQWFTEGGNGVAPTYPGADWFNIVQAELLNVLKKAGINPDKANHEQLTRAIQKLGGYDFLIGLPLPYPKTTVPTGCLALLGQSISQSTYPVLYNLYGGTLPDLRGEFIRGWDNGRGIDSGRGILSAQGDAIRNITGSVRTDNGWMFSELRGAFFDHSGGENVQQLRNQVLASDSHSAPTVGWFDFDASKSGVPTAAENRPRNIAMQYICLAG